ncbi:hypothetical protein IAT40_000030 [Kwoniella sp. CBS 6097]
MTHSADASVSLPLPSICTPSLKPAPNTDFEPDMSHVRFVQPFDLSRYHSPSLPFPMDLDDEVHTLDDAQHAKSNLLQLSSDKSNLNRSPLNLLVQPPAVQTSPTPSYYPTPELPQRQIDLHGILRPQPRSVPETPSQLSQSLEQADSKTPLRRALGLDRSEPSQVGGWPGKAYTSQVYEPPHQASNLTPNYGSGHSHSHSTPAFTPHAPYGTPYQSHTSTPYEHAHAHSYSYSYSNPDSTPGPFQASSLPDGYKLPQPGYWSHSQTPSTRWESHSPYQQPMYATFGMDERSEDEKRRERLVKARRHVCPVCDKRFNRPSSLNTHMAVHTGAKPYICNRPDCGRRFSVSSNLRRHERTHGTRAARERQAGIETIHRISQPGATPVYDEVPHEPYKFPQHQAETQPQSQSQTQTQAQSLSPPFSYTYYHPYATPPPVHYPTPSSTACSGTDATPSIFNPNGPASTTDFGLAQYQVVTKPRRVMELGMERFEFPRRTTAIGQGHIQGHAHSASVGSASTEMDAKAELLLC